MERRKRKSHPSRVRGLKFGDYLVIRFGLSVAPLAGAWIEINMQMHLMKTFQVAPLAGAWIEISGQTDNAQYNASHPSRVRGLKSTKEQRAYMNLRRTPRGCVD